MKKIKGTFFVEKEYLDNKIFSIQENKKNHYKYSKYISIRDGFLKKGIEINTQDISKESDTDFTIYLDYPKRILAKKKYIIVREPRIIIPNNHNYKKLNKFNKIFTYNDKLVDNTKFIKFINGSYDFSKVKKYKSESQNGYVLICRNKKSFKDGESYSLRNQIITFFESSNLTFDLYGFGWDRKNFNYKIIEVLFNRMKMKRPSSNLVNLYLDNSPPIGTILNVNVPHCSLRDLKGYRATVQGKQYFDDNFDERIDPRGRKYYWMIGEMIDNDKNLDCDGIAIKNNYVSITPINFEMSNIEYFNQLKKEIKE